MSHSVEKMFFTNAHPWWYGNSSQRDAIGVDLGDGPVTSREAIEAAGLDWNVIKAQGGYQTGATTIDGDPVWREAAGDRFLIRETDGTVLGRCKDGYELFQNREAFEFLDGLARDGELLYHTAGSLEGGQRVWILAQTPETWTITRRSGAVNTHAAFLNCMIGHDGASAISLMPTDIRVECANTLGFADSRAEGQNLVFRIPHRGDIEKKLELAAQAIKTMSTLAVERREVLQSLAQTAMNTDEFMDFAISIFLGLDGTNGEVSEGVAKFYEDVTPRSKTIMENKVADMANRFERGLGNEGDSAYDALQAVTEYFDHFSLDHVRDNIERGKRAAKAVSSAWIGAGAERKALAYKRLKAMQTR